MTFVKDYSCEVSSSFCIKKYLVNKNSKKSIVLVGVFRIKNRSWQNTFINTHKARQKQESVTTILCYLTLLEPIAPIWTVQTKCPRNSIFSHNMPGFGICNFTETVWPGDVTVKWSFLMVVTVFSSTNVLTLNSSVIVLSTSHDIEILHQ